MVTLDLWNRRRASPFSIFDEIFGALSELEKSSYLPRQLRSTPYLQDFYPNIEVTEKKDGYLLSLDLPGVKKEDVSIEVTGGKLIVKGERKRVAEHKEENVFRSERSYGSFTRTFDLPEGTNTEQIEASFEDGVLKLTVPKVEEKTVRKIEIGEPSQKGFLNQNLGTKSELKIAKG